MQDQDFLITVDFIKNGNKLNEFLQGLINLEQDIKDLENTIESQDKNNIFVRKLMQEHDKKADIYNQAMEIYKYLKYERYKETLAMIKKLERLTESDLQAMKVTTDLYNKLLDVLKENADLLKPKLKDLIRYKLL
ncbi:hypothetical protein FYL05_07310 [Lactobacillus salivarius]|uniref:Uncharacterized protein n=2 Tax=Ligilactobacillus salivarius TaxID=1624 RepID=A0ABD6JDK5_9LACO|nr:hypothetical protein [Ligilactobacillus salivarius]MYY45866.1 hypothetical protein [Ligilactobacillus salivarius]MYZ67225.1 hypothetical protein [Ligilactobacillus salivarius]